MTQNDLTIETAPSAEEIQAGIARAHQIRSEAFHKGIAKLFGLFHHVASDRPVVSLTGRASSTPC